MIYRFVLALLISVACLACTGTPIIVGESPATDVKFSASAFNSTNAVSVVQGQRFDDTLQPVGTTSSARYWGANRETDSFSVDIELDVPIGSVKEQFIQRLYLRVGSVSVGSPERQATTYISSSALASNSSENAFRFECIRSSVALVLGDGNSQELPHNLYPAMIQCIKYDAPRQIILSCTINYLLEDSLSSTFFQWILPLESIQH